MGLNEVMPCDLVGLVMVMVMGETHPQPMRLLSLCHY